MKNGMLFLMLSLSVPCMGRDKPIGLVNVGGASCYLNAILQVLCNSPFSAKLRELDPKCIMPGTLAGACYDFFASYEAGKGVSESQRALFDFLVKEGIYAEGVQDDPSLFLMALEESIVLSRGPKIGIETQKGILCPFINPLSIYLLQRYVCPEFSEVLNQHIPGIKLSYVVQEGTRFQMDSAFKQYFAMGEGMRTKQGKEHRCDVLERISQMPSLLCVTLNVLLRNLDGSVTKKETYTISFRINLDAWCADKAAQKGDYDLMGIVMHIGLSASGGHYISYVRYGNDWWECNDSRVDKVPDPAAFMHTLETVGAFQGGTPYLLFYVPAAAKSAEEELVTLAQSLLDISKV